MVLVQKWPFFQLLFVRQYRPGRGLCFRYSRTKKRLSWLWKKKFKKSKNCHFSKGVNPCFWFKNDHVSKCFFLGQIGHKNVFYDILERKNALLGYKNKKFKKSKNCHFSKGVNPWFLDKNGHFCNFFLLGKIGQENVLYYILARKYPFLGYKNKNFKKSKNCHFSKGVNPWFWSKNGHFCNFFFFKQYRPENVN